MANVEPEFDTESKNFHGVIISAQADIGTNVDFGDPDTAIGFAELLIQVARKAKRKKNATVTVWLHEAEAEEPSGDWLQVNHCWEVEKKSAKAGK